MTQPELIFEEPPRKGRRSEHHDWLRAVKAVARPDFARKEVDLDEKDANALASALRTAAAVIGPGFDVMSRYIPETGRHGVWVRYSEPVPTVEAQAEAAAMIAKAMNPPTAVPPDEDDWEMPEPKAAQA